MALRVLDENDEQIEVPTETLESLRMNRWTSDHETHRAMWEVQCLLQLVDASFGDSPNEVTNGEVIQVAIQGIERLMANAISRSGWTGLGERWEG